MMIVQYTAFWITNTVTQESIGAQSDPDRNWQSSVKGEVRTYAGGRQRAVGSLGASTVWQVRLVELTQVQVETLEQWMRQGVTVFARDHRGQAMYGTFFAVERGEHPAGLVAYARYSAAVEIQYVDVVEGV
jgi:hypothetical protein